MNQEAALLPVPFCRSAAYLQSRAIAPDRYPDHPLTPDMTWMSCESRHIAVRIPAGSLSSAVQAPGADQLWVFVLSRGARRVARAWGEGSGRLVERRPLVVALRQSR